MKRINIEKRILSLKKREKEYNIVIIEYIKFNI